MDRSPLTPKAEDGKRPKLSATTRIELRKLQPRGSWLLALARSLFGKHPSKAAQSWPTEGRDIGRCTKEHTSALHPAEPSVPAVRQWTKQGIEASGFSFFDQGEETDGETLPASNDARSDVRLPSRNQEPRRRVQHIPASKYHPFSPYTADDCCPFCGSRSRNTPERAAK